MADLLRLFELADEFGMTTGQALDLCDHLGISAESGTTLLTATDAEAIRAAAHAAGLGDRAVGPAHGARTWGPEPAIAPPPGWVRADSVSTSQQSAPDAPVAPDPATTDTKSGSTFRRRRSRRR